MASKVCALLASVLLIQSASARFLQEVVEVVSSAPAFNLGGCGSNLLGSSLVGNNAFAVNGLVNNAYGVNGLVNNAYGVNGLVNNAYGVNGLVNNAYGVNGLGLGLSNDALSVASGSAYAPGSISILGENLSILGEVSVVGSAPFIGTVGVSGAVPTSGQALVSYNSAPGLGLTSGGCGQGVSSGAVCNNVGLGGLNNVGLAGLNGVGLVNNVGLAGFNNGLGNNLGFSSCVY